MKTQPSIGPNNTNFPQLNPEPKLEPKWAAAVSKLNQNQNHIPIWLIGYQMRDEKKNEIMSSKCTYHYNYNHEPRDLEAA